MKNLSSLATPRKLSSIATAVIMLSITGLFQFITLGADFSQLKTASFWLTLAYRALLVILAYNCALDLLFDRCYAHPNITDTYNRLKELSKLRDTDFDEFINTRVNPENKKRAWRKKINKKIAKLEKRTLRIFSLKKKDKLKVKIDELKEKLTDEYIDPRIETLKVNYYVVCPSDFLLGEFDEFGVPRNKTRVDYGLQKTKSMGRRLMSFLLVSMVIGCTVSNTINKSTIDVILGILWDLGIISMRVAQGVSDSQKLVDLAYLVPYSNRVDILKQYVNWSSNKPDTKSKKMLNFIEEQERIKKDSNNG